MFARSKPVPSQRHHAPTLAICPQTIDKAEEKSHAGLVERSTSAKVLLQELDRMATAEGKADT